MERSVIRRLFIVPMANNDHGKSSIIKSLTIQGIARDLKIHQKSVRVMVCPNGRKIDSYIFGRSYQEVERTKFGSISDCLFANDPDWYKRELIVMPSHVEKNDLTDVQEMIEIGHEYGFDVVAVPVIFEQREKNNRAQLKPFLSLPWDERWTVINPEQKSTRIRDSQLRSIGCDLWFKISKSMVW